MKANNSIGNKKVYLSPKLADYGDLAQMTKTAPSNPGGMEMATGAPKT
jgi:hypothetical protein